MSVEVGYLSQPAKFVNLTPHAVLVYGDNAIEDGPLFTFSPSGEVARVANISLGFNTIGKVVYEMVEYGRLENPPKVKPGTYYIVSLVTALAVKGRDDILAPYNEVRNSKGQIIGCRNLQKVC